jgi:hypothetical protein
MELRNFSEMFVDILEHKDPFCGLVSAFLAANPEVPSSIPGITKFSE